MKGLVMVPGDASAVNQQVVMTKKEAPQLVTGSNQDTAFKLLLESQIEDLLVKPGHAKPGELIAVLDESDGSFTITSTSERSAKEIFAIAYPPEEKPAPKIPEFFPDQKPLNRAERRAQRRR